MKSSMEGTSPTLIREDRRSCPLQERWVSGWHARHRRQNHDRFVRATGLRPNFGLRQIRTCRGNSAYYSVQWRVDHRFACGFQVTGSYAWSRNIDNTSEGVGTIGGSPLWSSKPG